MTILLACMSLFSAVVFTSCDSSKEKTEKAETKLEDAAEDLTKAKINEKSDSLKLVSKEEWALFKASTESQIKAHEIRIEFLKKSLKQSQPKQSKELLEKIDVLEGQNKALKDRLEAYDKVQGDWASFKHEFAYDMDQLGSALKSFTIPNK